jgi:hypothetical protein
MILEIPVTEVVFKVLLHTYATDSFDLSRRDDMYMTFMSMRTFAEAMPQPQRHPGRMIHLAIPETPALLSESERLQPLLQAGYFYQAELRKLIFQWVRSQEALAASLRLPVTLFSLRKSLALFCQHYNISDDEYDYASMYRQLHRIFQRPLADFTEAIKSQYDFQPGNNWEYKPCRLEGYNSRSALIEFDTFSRSAAQVVTFSHQHSNNDLGHIKVVMDVINRLLIDGYSAQ